jgi:hypothetical protein
VTSARKFILDTDFATDVGDFGVTALACAAHRVGWIDLVAIMCNTSVAKGPGGIDAVRTWFGLPSIPIGTWKGTEHNNGSYAFVNELYDNFPRTVGLASTVDDATTTYREVLAAQADGSVTIVSAGYLHNVAALLNSSADGISALTGAELVEAKVARLYIMGSMAPSNGTEWNMVGGHSATAGTPADSSDVAANWPTEIVWGGYGLGTFTVGGQLDLASGHIVYDAYTAGGYSSGRTAWDEITLLAAIQHDADFTLTRGTNAINSTTGANTWTTTSAGNHFALGKTQADEWYQARINALIAADPLDDPLISSWGSAPAYIQVTAS